MYKLQSKRVFDFKFRCLRSVF